MRGLELSRRYFAEVAAPSFRTSFPDIYARAAAGLVGNGSECFGFDDELSRDHDWGADFFIWLTEEDKDNIPALLCWKKALFEENPPAHIRTRSEYGAEIGILTIGDFYSSLIGYPEGPREIREWRLVPEENLALAVNGEVFMDNAGKFTAVRKRLLCHYPEDIRRKKLAASCMAMAQTGQYNLRRCHIRRDWVTYRAVLARFCDSASAAVFLLNRVFRPYYKWAYRKMTSLPLLGAEAASLLYSLAVTEGAPDELFCKNSPDVDALCALIAGELRRQGLSSSDDWFLAAHGEEIRAGISDPFLRSLPAQYD